MFYCPSVYMYHVNLGEAATVAMSRIMLSFIYGMQGRIVVLRGDRQCAGTQSKRLNSDAVAGSSVSLSAYDGRTKDSTSKYAFREQKKAMTMEHTIRVCGVLSARTSNNRRLDVTDNWQQSFEAMRKEGSSR